MHIQRCAAADCGKPFQVNQFSTTFSDPTESGKIVCPHCGSVAEGNRNAFFITHALRDEDDSSSG